MINKNIYKLIEDQYYEIEGLCLWNNKYLLVCADGIIHRNVKIYNLETSKEEKRIIDGNIKILEAEKIKLNNYGESIVICDNENEYKIFSITNK